MSSIEQPFTPAMSLVDAREILRERADEGIDCPCCTRRVKAYRRPLTSVAARAIHALFEEAGRGWAHMGDVAGKRLADVASQGGQLVLGQHWDLIEPRRQRKPGSDGRGGYWRVTTLGELWVRGEESVPKYARIFKGRCLGLTGDLVGIADVLGHTFDLKTVHDVTPPSERHDEQLFADDGEPDPPREEAA